MIQHFIQVVKYNLIIAVSISMLETPKSRPKEQFTSPIGLLKKYSSNHTQNAQFSNTKPQTSHEEQFFKIKAHRLENELHETKEENIILRSKVSDLTANIQILKQQIYSLENNVSPHPQTQRNKNSNNNEVEKLLKEIRVLKNGHQIQMVKLQDENRKLKRKMLETSQSNKPNDHKQIQQLKKSHQQAYNRLLQQNQALRSEIKKYTENKSEIQKKYNNHQTQNSELKKQVEELKTILSAKNRYEEKYSDLLTKYESQSGQLQRVLQENRQILQSKNYLSPENVGSESQRVKIPDSSRIQVGGMKTYAEEIYYQSQNFPQDQRHQVRMLQMKVQQQEGIIAEKNTQIKSMLQKLKPLLFTEKGKREQSGDRASLSMLQIFLKKYKIASF